MCVCRPLTIGLLLGLLLGACSAPGPELLPPQAPTEHRLAPADPIAQWVLAQQDRARALEAQDDLAQALLIWDALVLLDPADAPARADRERLRSLIERQVAELMRRARQPERRADWGSAERIYLSVLALQPQHAEAARALRSLELRRTPRSSRLEFGVPADPLRATEARPAAPAAAPATPAASAPTGPRPLP